MEPKECGTCGRMFTPKYEWSKECMQCFFSSAKGRAWKEQKDAESNAFDRNKQRQQSREQEQERHQEKQQEQRYDHNFRNSFRQDVPGALSKDMLRKLLQLCHPDKHGGSALATAVTQELLKMKERL